MMSSDFSYPVWKFNRSACEATQLDPLAQTDMSLYALKPRFQNLLRPLTDHLARRGATANQVTLFAAGGSVVVGALAGLSMSAQSLFLLIPLWLLIRMALNAIDGMLAREHAQKSTLGAYLNELGDIVSDVALVLPFLAVSALSPADVWLFALAAVSVECAGLIGPLIGASRRYDGPFGKSDRALALGALALWIGTGLPVGAIAAWLWRILIVLSIATVVRRVQAGIAEAEIDGIVDRQRELLPLGTTSDMTARITHEAEFTTHDGETLFYRHWPATGDRCRGAVVLLHRGHEHSGRVAHLVDELNLPDFAFFAWDARGHGRSPGARGFSPGVAASVRDLQTFADHIRDVHGIATEDLAIVAQSVGAVLAATWVHDYAPPIRCLALASPAFDIKLYVPFAIPGLRLMHKLRGVFYVNSYVKPHYLTHDPERIASYSADPLITRPIAVNMLLDLHDTSKRIVDDAAAITVPTQLLISGADWVVHRGPQNRFFERLSSARKERIELPGFYHDTLGERDRAQALAPLRAFMLREFDEPTPRVSLTDADRYGAFHDEYATLSRPAASPVARAYWAATRAGLRVAGVLSNGIALGLKLGFDSGSTLDYVYRNHVQGSYGIGRLIDRTYLDSPGWVGIRQRKIHLEDLIDSAIGRLRSGGMSVRIVDIAAGHGRYVLDAIAFAARNGSAPEHIVLRDYSPVNVEAGRTLIAQRGLDTIARFETGDAFDEASLAALEPRPTLAIVSGLYELFGENALIERSLRGLAQAVPIGGYLVYTGQPWHPQLEFIARALNNHRGDATWVMRRRSQAEMDELVARAGFRKIEQRIDSKGIFTVSLAQRLAIA